MEKPRKPISQIDLKGILANLSRSGKYSEEMLQLISDDLKFGITKEELEIYSKKGLNIGQMRVISKCLRNGYGEEILSVIADKELGEYQMAVVVEFYEKGVPLDCIQSVITEKNTPRHMKEAYQNILKEIKRTEQKVREQEEEAPPEYVDRLMEEIRSVISKIEYQDKRYDALNDKLKIFEMTKKDEEIRNNLVASITEKEQLLEDQQDKLNQANAAIARLRRDVEEKERGMGKLQEGMNALKIKADGEKVEQRSFSNIDLNACLKQEDENKSAEKKLEMDRENGGKQNLQQSHFVYAIPPCYQMSICDATGKVVATSIFDKSIRKSNSVISFIAKLALKKKSHQNIVKMVASGDLLPEQLVQIRIAMEKGLKEKQLMELIHHKVPAEQMKEIIEIAVLENKMED